MAENTIAAVAAELVGAGWCRQDPDCRGLYRDLPGRNWWCHSTEPGLIEDDGPRQLISLHHRSGWVCTVAGDADSGGAVEDLTVWTPLQEYRHPYCLMTAGWWPGLQPLLAIAGSLMDSMPPASCQGPADG